jgi:hypothetical protein
VQELEAGPVHRFQDWPNDQVPKRAAGVYSVWDGDRLLYVGMSGRAMTAEDLEVSPNGRVVAKGLWTRLNAHAAGRREPPRVHRRLGCLSAAVRLGSSLRW